MRANPRVVLAFACALAGLPITAGASTYYVRMSGNDGNTGLDAGAAWRTIGHAAEQLLPGDEVIVGPGVYVEQNLKPRLSGSPSGHISFRGDPTGISTGDNPAGPVNINVGLGGSAFVLSGRQYVDISGFTITNSKNAAIFLLPGKDGQGNVVPTGQVRIANCTFHSNQGKGVIIRGAASTLIFNNLFYANQGGGISIGYSGMPSPGTQIINNTFYRNIGSGGYGNAISVGGGQPAPQTLVLNNISVANHRGITVSRDPRTASSYVGLYNCVMDGYSGAARRSVSDVTADPQLVNPAGPDGLLGGPGADDDDFHLALTSPAVNAGSDDSANLALAGASTREDGGKDAGKVDLGYHYGNDTLAPRTIIARTELYVRQTGSDLNSGRTPGQAFRTIGAAARQALPGDIIYVGPGVYAEGDIKTKRSGASEVIRISFVGDEGGAKTYDSPGPVIVDATGFRSGFRISKRSFVTVSGFRVSGAQRAGVLMGPGEQLVATNNIVYSNLGHGFQLADADGAMVVNDLVYNNGGAGIFIGGLSSGSARVLVTDNTIYANRRGGIRVGTPRFPAPGAVIAYNILRANRVLTPMNRPQGMLLTRASLSGLTLGYNLNSDSYVGINSPSTDIAPGDPYFVLPAGSDGILGGVGAADDDFHLTALKAGDPQNSPAIDAGLDCSSRVGFGFTGYTTQRDGARDSGAIDLGFHYAIPGSCASRRLCTLGRYDLPSAPAFTRCK